MFICSSEKGICLLEFADMRVNDKEFMGLQILFNSIITKGINKHIVQINQELNEYFIG